MEDCNRRGRSGAENMTNRRLFKASDGRIIETDFDVHWYAIDRSGSIHLYESAPNQCHGYGFWCPGSRALYVGNYSGSFDWELSRRYLDDNGKWVRIPPAEPR